jgi:hypothetical protein
LIEKDQGLVLAEEKYGIKKDIDQLYKNMRGRRASVAQVGPSNENTTVNLLEIMMKENVESMA